MQDQRTKNSPARVGLIGAGAVVADYHLPALSACTDIRPAWIMDQDQARARRVAARFRVPRVLSSLSDRTNADAVLLAVPVGARLGLFAELCRHECAILCEKPFAANLTEHREMLALASARSLRVAAGFMRRNYWCTSTAGQLLRGGSLGPVQSVHASANASVRGTGRGRDWYQADPKASGGGVLMETGCHLIDQIFTLLNASAFSIEECSQRRSGGLEYESRVRGSIREATGRWLPFKIAISAITDLKDGIMFQCASGGLLIGLGPDSPVTICRSDGQTLASFPAPLPALPSVFAAFAAEWRQLLTMEAEDAAREAATGLLTTEFIDTCYRAS